MTKSIFLILSLISLAVYSLKAQPESNNRLVVFCEFPHFFDKDTTAIIKKISELQDVNKIKDYLDLAKTKYKNSLVSIFFELNNQPYLYYVDRKGRENLGVIPTGIRGFSSLVNDMEDFNITWSDSILTIDSIVYNMNWADAELSQLSFSSDCDQDNNFKLEKNVAGKLLIEYNNIAKSDKSCLITALVKDKEKTITKKLKIIFAGADTKEKIRFLFYKIKNNSPDKEIESITKIVTSGMQYKGSFNEEAVERYLKQCSIK